jgi:16S rRNA (adenine1518-N6/adenine1519-N6)-dimethyltransferase
MIKPYLANPARTREILRKHDFSTRKKYGQNFLIDESVLLDTIEAAGITKDDFVLEVGPGIGTLTQYLAYYGGHVCAVELDKTLLPILKDTLSGFDNAEVIPGDILKTDIAALADEKNGGRPIKVVANLPYYITTPIVFGLLASRAPISSMTFMVQKEVAERMQAGPGTKSYGSLSLAVQYYTKPVINRIVPPSSFIPQPGVDSAVVTLSMHEKPPVTVLDEAHFFDLIRASFNQRRKKLSNGIVNYPGFSYTKEDAEEALAKCGLPPAVRGEALTLSQFAQLSDQLQEGKNRQK